jgi:serine phosphatase RsbU (regulator of sigma subunit)
VRLLRIYFFFSLLFFSVELVSQTGNFFINNYSPKIYESHIQNVDVIQDDFGLMYFANNSAIVEYNGKTWRTIKVSSNSKTPCSFAKSKDGKIYVGSENEIGYLKRNKLGETEYVSLSELLPEKERDFKHVWNTFVIGNDVFFCANEKILKYDRFGKFKSWKPETSFHKAQVVKGKLFVREVGKGLMYLDGNELKKINGSEIFGPADYKIAFYLEYKAPNQYLIFTRKKGVFIFDIDPLDISKSTIKKSTQKEFEKFDEYEPYDGLKLNNSNIVIGTIDKGLLLLDNEFTILQNINSSYGLINDECRRLYLDKQNNLWVAFNNGISKIEITSALSVWDNHNKIDGNLEKIIKYNDVLYLASSKGLFFYDNTSRTFNLVSDFNYRCLDLEIVKDKLYIASENGLYYYDTKKIAPVLEDGIITRLGFNADHPDLLFCGTENGVTVVNCLNDQINKEIENPLISKSTVSSFGFLENGTVFASTISEGIFYFNINNSDSVRILPENGFFNNAAENYILNYNNKLYIGSDSGLYTINKDLSFNSVVKVNDLIKGKFSVTKFAFKNNDLFLFLDRNNGFTKISCFRLNNDTTSKERFPSLNKFDNVNIKQFYFDYLNVYIVADNNIYVFAEKKETGSTELRSYLSKVIYNGNVIFFNLDVNKELTFNYNQNKFVFEFAANDFRDESKLQFQYYLEGYENGYNDWSLNHIASYDNIKLAEGNYKFHLRVKNSNGDVSKELTFSFEILAPWYRTIIAYVLYILSAIILVYLIVKNRLKNLENEKIKLEKIVEERTQEVVKQKDEITAQKHLVDEKHKEITDSINYAERIQRSFLATKELLDGNLKDYFVFFQPKDVVSGDFYWASKLSNSTFALVTADSTGHGVPGAIMSILNISSLEHAVEQGLLEPSEILNHTRNTIIKRLKKDGSAEGGKDGMDASLICFDFKNNKLTYAAANNPIWIIREGAIIELAPDKMPVGKGERDTVPFTQHSVDLMHGDVVYALTDGMPDQFGGPKGKKFMYKKLKELLITISIEPADKQKQLLSSALNDWKGNLEQVDDVCIIGVRV